MHHFINVIENGDNSVTKLACRRLTNNLRKRNFRLNSTIPLSDAYQLTDKTYNFAFKNLFMYNLVYGIQIYVYIFMNA